MRSCSETAIRRRGLYLVFVLRNTSAAAVGSNIARVIFAIAERASQLLNSWRMNYFVHCDAQIETTRDQLVEHRRGQRVLHADS